MKFVKLFGLVCVAMLCISGIAVVGLTDDDSSASSSSYSKTYDTVTAESGVAFSFTVHGYNTGSLTTQANNDRDAIPSIHPQSPGSVTLTNPTSGVTVTRSDNYSTPATYCQAYDYVVSGTISTTGLTNISWTVVSYVDLEDTNTYYYTLPISITGTTTPLSFTAPPALDIISGATFSYTPATNITSTITKTSGASWLSMSDGVLSGTAPSVSSATLYQAVLTAVSGSQTVTQTISFYVYPVLAISGNSSISGYETVAVSSNTYTANVTSSWSLSGTLPDGLSFSNGVISGTPADGSAGVYTVSVYAQSTLGGSQTAYKTVSISINENLAITSEFPTSAVIPGNLYTYLPTANTTAVWSISSAPSWLVWDSASNGVKGTVPADTVAGSYTYTLSAVANGQTVTQSVTVTVGTVLEFTSIPTVSMIITPIYDYSNGSGSPAVFGACVGVNDSVADDDSVSYTTKTFKFTYSGSGAESLLWDFGDGNTSTEWSPIHKYSSAGTYTVTCTATNTVGSASTSQSITISDEAFDDSTSTYIVVAFVLILMFLAYVFLTKGAKR